ncbi:hypothetical protein [Anaerotignum lactatifermentans]|uniref:hypothetical protein n=1 Tax=Anaerotignum lactatifermentans TaxID=160404 RepID=UPI0024B1FDC9|nr:hypothetical protein [Anaerotignum lactatifermentans]
MKDTVFGQYLFFVQKEGRGVCVFVLRGFFAVSGGWWRVERLKKGGGRKNVATAGGRICEKNLEKSAFSEEKKKKKTGRRTCFFVTVILQCG